MTKPCVICGEPADVETPTEPGICSAFCHYTLEAEVGRPLAGESLTEAVVQDEEQDRR